MRLGVSVLEEAPSLSLSLSYFEDRGKAAVCKPGGGLSPGTLSACTLTLGPSASRPVRSKCLLRHFVTEPPSGL